MYFSVTRFDGRQRCAWYSDASVGRIALPQAQGTMWRVQIGESMGAEACGRCRRRRGRDSRAWRIGESVMRAGLPGVFLAFAAARVSRIFVCGRWECV